MAEADNPDNPAFGAQPLQSSASNAHASGQVIVQAPTAAILGKQITSGGQDGSDRRSQASGRSTASSVLRKRQLNKAAEANAPRPWPDDREYNPRAFFLFTLQHPIRQTAIRCIEWGKKPGSRFGWDKKVLIMILLNTITLAMMDPFDVEEMRPCDPAAANTPPGIYDYCDKMTTGDSDFGRGNHLARFCVPSVGSGHCLCNAVFCWTQLHAGHERECTTR
jgi:hypothetical protein